MTKGQNLVVKDVNIYTVRPLALQGWAEFSLESLANIHL